MRIYEELFIARPDGTEEEIERAVSTLAARGVSATRLVVSHAFHSRMIEPMLDEFAHAASSIHWSRPKIPVISNLTGTTEMNFDPAYWRRHAREAVRFADGVAALCALGCEVFVEVGPHPTLIAMGRDGAEGGRWIPSLRRGAGEWRTLLDAAGSLFTSGAEIDFAAIDRGQGRRKVPLPTYPFQRERYWVEPSRTPARPGAARSGHPLLGERMRVAGARETRFESVIDSASFLRDHKVYDRIVFPAAGYIEGRGDRDRGHRVSIGAHARWRCHSADGVRTATGRVILIYSLQSQG